MFSSIFGRGPKSFIDPNTRTSIEFEDPSEEYVMVVAEPLYGELPQIMTIQNAKYVKGADNLLLWPHYINYLGKDVRDEINSKLNDFNNKMNFILKRWKGKSPSDQVYAQQSMEIVNPIEKQKAMENILGKAQELFQNFLKKFTVEDKSGKAIQTLPNPDAFAGNEWSTFKSFLLSLYKEKGQTIPPLQLFLSLNQDERIAFSLAQNKLENMKKQVKDFQSNVNISSQLRTSLGEFFDFLTMDYPLFKQKHLQDTMDIEGEEERGFVSSRSLESFFSTGNLADQSVHFDSYKIGKEGYVEITPEQWNNEYKEQKNYLKNIISAKVLKYFIGKFKNERFDVRPVIEEFCFKYYETHPKDDLRFVANRESSMISNFSKIFQQYKWIFKRKLKSIVKYLSPSWGYRSYMIGVGGSGIPIQPPEFTYATPDTYEPPSRNILMSSSKYVPSSFEEESKSNMPMSFTEKPTSPSVFGSSSTAGFSSSAGAIKPEFPPKQSSTFQPTLPRPTIPEYTPPREIEYKFLYEGGGKKTMTIPGNYMLCIQRNPEKIGLASLLCECVQADQVEDKYLNWPYIVRVGINLDDYSDFTTAPECYAQCELRGQDIMSRLSRMETKSTGHNLRRWIMTEFDRSPNEGRIYQNLYVAQLNRISAICLSVLKSAQKDFRKQAITSKGNASRINEANFISEEKIHKFIMRLEKEDINPFHISDVTKAYTAFLDPQNRYKHYKNRVVLLMALGLAFTLGVAIYTNPQLVNYLERSFPYGKELTAAISKGLITTIETLKEHINLLKTNPLQSLLSPNSHLLNIGSGVSSGISNVASTIGGTASTISGAIGGAASTIGGTASTISGTIGSVASGIGSVASGIGNVISGTTSAIGGVAGSISSAVGSIFT